ncbi:HAMP domain-containing sensor histidine kinase [Xenophilus azovorans]|uniref:sensor histidine kinase n=1 Tax=Xenophilus TaxID=151754 RepID=UPI00056DDFC2|nr:HAMP domain-containing sensor histidine kinase [Xenophilus azovorans]
MTEHRPGSLAARLARTLILSVGGVWLACVLGVVWYVDREINFNFDNELVEVSHRMFDIAAEQYDQLSHGQVPQAPLVAPPPMFIEDEVIYQVVDGGTRVLLRSSNATPEIFDVPLAPGFQDTREWRIYTVRHPTRDLFMQVADPIGERRHAVNRTLVGLIVPMIAVLPLLALVLRQIARRELRVLQRLADEIALRSGADLRPIRLPGLPQELRSVADDVNRLLERLSHALDVERALAANAAHELRTPLAAARLRLQTALEHTLDRAEVEAALAALRTLSHRTEKLLQLSRAESGASLARTPVDLVRLAGTVAEEFWQDESAARLLELKVPDAPAAPAVGDVDALAIALRNLVENALRYGQGAGVTLEVAAPCTLIVRDAGPGVTPEQLGTLRRRHVRHGDDRTGYGLGLSIVATIVQQHGARLELASPPAGLPQGFEARIVLPPA